MSSPQPGREGSRARPAFPGSHTPRGSHPLQQPPIPQGQGRGDHALGPGCLGLRWALRGPGLGEGSVLRQTHPCGGGEPRPSHPLRPARAPLAWGHPCLRL